MVVLLALGFACSWYCFCGKVQEVSDGGEAQNGAVIHEEGEPLATHPSCNVITITVKEDTG